MKQILGLRSETWDTRQNLHMTVPKDFRRSGATPEGLMLYYVDLPESDIAAPNGYRLVQSHVSKSRHEAPTS